MRIDHFRGFDEYFAIPYGDTTAANGKWMPGPGMDIMRAIKERFGDRPIIAEDLGFLTPTVLQLVKDTGYPGMKLLQFAFDSREPGDYLPHNYPHNCVLYTGTHDNDTVMGWKEHVSAEDLDFTRRYLNIHPGDALNWSMIRAAFASVADTVIIPMQDYLGLGSEARINTPSTLGRNWQWRMKPDAIAPRAGRTDPGADRAVRKNVSQECKTSERKMLMLEFRYDTQLLIEGENLDEDAINDYFVEHFKG